MSRRHKNLGIDEFVRALVKCTDRGQHAPVTVGYFIWEESGADVLNEVTVSHSEGDTLVRASSSGKCVAFVCRRCRRDVQLGVRRTMQIANGIRRAQLRTVDLSLLG